MASPKSEHLRSKADLELLSANTRAHTEACTPRPLRPLLQHDTERCALCDAVNVRDKSNLKEAKDERRNQVG